MARAFVAVGSNIDPAGNVRNAVRLLARHTRIVAVSTVYLTEPEARPDQPPFYNCVVAIDTDLDPITLKYEVLRCIESDLGRKRTSDKHAPRTIDLDLILYDDLVLQAGDLVIPDPELAKRAFLTLPLNELAPDLMIPGTSSKVSELAMGRFSDGMLPLEDYTARLKIESRSVMGMISPATARTSARVRPLHKVG
jgi:2-amino-4-hydroxy-6-hydroxymethyldihydropteridine diphosphokinase